MDKANFIVTIVLIWAFVIWNILDIINNTKRIEELEKTCSPQKIENTIKE